MSLALRVLAPALLLLTACAQVDVDARVGGGWDELSARTWAWLQEPDALNAGALEEGPPAEQLATRWREAVEAGFAAAGWTRVDRREAAYLLEFRTSLGVRSRSVDPYFAITTGERMEEGSLELRLIEPTAGRTAWSGTGTATLRRIARQIGVVSKSWDPTDEPREWPVAKLVKAVLAELPGTEPAEEGEAL